jgi:phage tail-like protein
MPNRREFDHIGGYSFRVEIEGGGEGTFTEVSGLEVITEVLETADGDDLLVRKRPGRTTCSNIVLRRGFTNDDELFDWLQAFLDGTANRRSGSIIICDNAGNPITRYNFYEAWPCRWKMSPFSAQHRGTLIEEIELVVEKIERG